MTSRGHRICTYMLTRRWPAVVGALSLLLTVLVWVVEPDSSAAQEADPFEVTVSKTTDLVSGETVEVNVRTVEGTVLYPGTPSRIYTCRKMADGYEYVEADFTNGTCVTIGAHLSEVDNSVDGDRFHRFPDAGPEGGRRGITILRPGVGTANWRLGGVDHSVTCGPSDPCVLVYQIQVLWDGATAPEVAIRRGPDLGYRPDEGIVGCEGRSPNVITSTMPDRLQDPWLSWTRDVCQTADSPPPTSAFFAPEGEALGSFAAGEFDLTYSAVGYRPGFDPPTERQMVPVPIGLNAVVLAVGGGYPVVDNTWPTDFPKPHTEFRLTNQHIATLIGQWEQALVFSDLSNEVLANNPQIPGLMQLLNPAVGSALALTGAQSTTLFASTHLDTLAPDEWRSAGGVSRGVETDFNAADPPHATGELDLKTGRPDLARIVYRELYSQGTYYVLTDLATANALGLTVVSIPDPASPGGWVTPTAETLAAAVPHMQEQADGTLLPNPNAPAGYPLTYVEYAMAPAQPLVDATCQRRTESQQLLTDWLGYVTTDGQGQLPLSDGGLVPLTSELRAAATTAVGQIGATPPTCTATPPTTTPPTTNPDGAPGSSFGPDGSSGRPGSGSSLAGSSSNPDGLDGATRPASPATIDEAREAAEDDDVELPGLTGIRAINKLWSPVSLLLIVILTSAMAVFTAGYQLPAGLRRAARSGLHRLGNIRLPRWTRKATT